MFIIIGRLTTIIYFCLIPSDPLHNCSFSDSSISCSRRSLVVWRDISVPSTLSPSTPRVAAMPVAERTVTLGRMVQYHSVGLSFISKTSGWDSSIFGGGLQYNCFKPSRDLFEASPKWILVRTSLSKWRYYIIFNIGNRWSKWSIIKIANLNTYQITKLKIAPSHFSRVHTFDDSYHEFKFDY